MYQEKIEGWLIMKHKNEQYRRMSKREFITMIEEEYDDNDEFNVHTFDFDSGSKISTVEYADKKEINCIAKKSKCIIFSGNKYISSVNIHSVNQPDIYNIQPKGIMKTILLDRIE